MKNSGKIFEEDIKKSIPEEYFVYRLRDSSGAWGEGTKTRFTPNNICDFIVHANGWLHLIELKSHKGASIPISPKKNKDGKITHYGVIKANQLEGLLKEHHKSCVYSSFIFNLADKEKTYWVDCGMIADAINKGLKSLSLEWLEKYGILIPQQIKRTRYKYDLSNLLD